MKQELGIAGRIAHSFIHSKLTPLFIVAALLIGIVAVLEIPREEEPQFIVPMLDVMTALPGASPAEVEPREHASLTMRFERVVSGGQSIPLHLSLRALASPLEVDAAQTQNSGLDRGSTPAWSQTVMLVGLTDVVYREDGTVIDGEDEVGRSVYAGDWGVMSRVASTPGMPCRAAVAGNDRPQALWVFSHDACGVYGYEMTIASAGRGDPKGTVVLTGQLRELKLRGGTAMLLRVN